MRRTSRIALACLILFLGSPPTPVHSWTKTQTVPDTKREKRKGNWRPGVTILGRDKKAVAEAMVSRMMDTGWSVANSSDYLLVFEKPAGTMVELINGIGSRWSVSYNLVEMNGNVRIVADIAVVRQGAFGRNERMDMNGGKSRNNIQDQLEELEVSLSRVVPPPPPAPDTTATTVAPDSTTNVAPDSTTKK